MIAIGIRVYSNSKVYYALIEKTANGFFNYIDISHINVPQALEKPEQLNFVRNTILDIMTEYKVKSAVIRLSEYGGSMRATTIERYFLEGVIQESLASCTVDKFCAGQISKLSSILGIPRTDFKKYASADEVLDNFSWAADWSDLTNEQRESVLACRTAINL